MPLLQVNDIHVSYGSVDAVRGISIAVEPGEVVALLGSNGAGKTTTLRTISGLQRAQQGSILFAGSDVSRLPAHVVVGKGIGHVPEGRHVFGTLTVLENLNLGGYLLRGRPDEFKDRRTRVLQTFPVLEERLHQLAGTLSGGEQQMLAIGRAMMNRPRLLMLDEPSLGLSPVLARKILKVVKGFASEGVGILLVEQNARQALAVSDRAYVLETGRIALEGSANEIAADPRIRQAYLGESLANIDA
jgi:branched-chain amino acid transport system ATP-binding protein